MREAVALLRRLRGSFRTGTFETEMAAELELHIEFEAEALVSGGMSPEAARAEARRRFGSVAHSADACRDSWGIRALDVLAQDLRFAGRTLARHRASSILATLTLGFGIASTTAVFSIVHAVLLRSLPYASGDALVEIRQQAPRAGIQDLNLSAVELDEYRRDAASLDAIVEYHQMGFNLVDRANGTRTSHVVTGVVSAAFFDVIGVQPFLGRTFVSSDDQKGAEPVLILSHTYWKTGFAADPNVIGRRVEMNDRTHVIVGVLPPLPQFPDENDVYMPVAACPFRSAPHMAADRSMRMVSAIGRMKPGATLEQTRRELAGIAARMTSAFPDVYGTAGFTATALSVHEQLAGRARPTLLLLLASTACVLLLVCANAASLTLARMADRTRELALRAALGAGRGRIVRQLLTENLALAAAGGGLALVFAMWARDLLVAFTLRFTPLATEVRIDRTVLAFTLAASIASGLLVGVPALRNRPACRRTRAARSRQLFIAAQVAIVFVLLVGAGLLARSFVNLQRADGGFSTDHVLTARVDLDWVKYTGPEQRRLYFRPLLAKLESSPGVLGAALSLTFPLNQSTPFNAELLVEGRPASRERPHADFRLASPAYFDAIGMRVLDGRAFNAGDTAGAEPVAIVNESMARHQLAGARAVGRRVSFDRGTTWRTVVGVVNDVRQYGLADPAVDEVYLPFDQQGPLSARILLRTAVDPREMLGTVQRIAADVDPMQPLSRVQTLDEVRRGSLSSPRVTAMLVNLLAVLALIVTASGIAGVVACSVSERTVEIGVRMALGARARGVVRLMIVETLRPVLAGAVCGLGSALILMRAAASWLYGVGPTDLPTYVAVAVTVGIVAALACMVPACRAARIDPMRALRAE